MNNVAAESLLLACFVQFPNAFFECADFLSEEDFSHPGHVMLFAIIKSLYMDQNAEKLSRLKIISQAKTLGIEDFKSRTKDYAVLDQVLDAQVQETDFKQSYLTVKRFSILRKYDESFIAQRAYIKSTTDGLSEIVNKIEKDVFSVPDIIDQGRHGISNLGKDAKSVIEELAKTPGQIGLDVGLPVWQHKAGQIRNAGVTFIAATAKSGKSQFGLSRAYHVGYKLQLPVLYCDSELNKNEQIVRLVGIAAEVPYQVIETGYWKLSDDELRAANILEADIPQYAEYRRRMSDQTFWDRVARLPIDYMSIAGIGMEEVLPRIRRWIMTRVKPSKDAKYPECLIVYDYIKLATIDELKGGKIGEHQVHGFNMIALHELCQHYNVPVLAFGQTNRELDTDTRCIAGAKRIEDNVTSMTLLKRKTDEELGFDPSGDHLLRVFGGRFGPGTPTGHININFDKSRGLIKELGYSNVDFALKKAEKLAEWKKRRYDKDDD